MQLQILSTALVVLSGVAWRGEIIVREAVSYIVVSLANCVVRKEPKIWSPARAISPQSRWDVGVDGYGKIPREFE